VFVGPKAFFFLFTDMTADLPIQLVPFNIDITIRPAAMFLVWIVFTAAAKVITSRGKCILSVKINRVPDSCKD
jgi:hypothetical protein